MEDGHAVGAVGWAKNLIITSTTVTHYEYDAKTVVISAWALAVNNGLQPENVAAKSTREVTGSGGPTGLLPIVAAVKGSRRMLRYIIRTAAVGGPRPV